jgi:hypothetical protein
MRAGEVTDGLLNRLDRLELLVVTGKGGVGKSTVSAALGAYLANRGRKVLLIEVDPRENLHQLLDTPPSGGEIVEAASNLWLQHLDPRELLDDLVREKLKVGALARKVLASPVHLLGAESPRESGAPPLHRGRSRPQANSSVRTRLADDRGARAQAVPPA